MGVGWKSALYSLKLWAIKYPLRARALPTTRLPIFKSKYEFCCRENCLNKLNDKWQENLFLQRSRQTITHFLLLEYSAFQNTTTQTPSSKLGHIFSKDLSCLPSEQIVHILLNILTSDLPLFTPHSKIYSLLAYMIKLNTSI